MAQTDSDRGRLTEDQGTGQPDARQSVPPVKAFTREGLPAVEADDDPVAARPADVSGPMDLPDFLVRDPDGFIRLSGHRIGLKDVVRLYTEGYTPEMLAEELPSLSLALIYKVLAFYLENRSDVDAYVADEQAEFERHAATFHQGPSMAELRRRLEAIRRAEST